MTRKPKSSLSFRKILQQVHLWVGVVLSVPFVLIGITGSILVFEHELADLTGPAPVRASATGEPRPISEMVAAATTAAPTGSSPTMVSAPEDPGDPATVRFVLAGRAQPGPGGVQVLVDPVSLEVLATRQPTETWLRKIFFLHANFMVRGDRSGREAIGWVGVAMAVLGASGLVLWWPKAGRLKQALTFTWKARGARFHRDLHGAVGFWGLIVFMVVTISGVYLAFPQPMAAAIRSVMPARDLRAGLFGPGALKVTPVAGTQPRTIDEAVAIAIQAVPGTQFRFAGLATRPDQPLRIGLVRPGHEQGAPMTTVLVDPWAGRAMEVRDPRTYTLGETIMAWQHALHAGEGLGWTWKILVFLSGFLPLLFAVTGISMWLIKRRNRRRTAALQADPAE